MGQFEELEMLSGLVANGGLSSPPCFPTSIDFGCVASGPNINGRQATNRRWQGNVVAHVLLARILMNQFSGSNIRI